MIKREISQKILDMSEKFPVITVTTIIHAIFCKLKIMSDYKA